MLFVVGTIAEADSSFPFTLTRAEEAIREVGLGVVGNAEIVDEPAEGVLEVPVMTHTTDVLVKMEVVCDEQLDLRAVLDHLSVHIQLHMALLVESHSDS